MKEIEIWADSFHEGVWCCDNICASLVQMEYTYTNDYLNGFIPHYVIKKNNVGVTIRREFGSNISAACGQLRSKREEL